MLQHQPIRLFQQSLTGHVLSWPPAAGHHPCSDSRPKSLLHDFWHVADVGDINLETAYTVVANVMTYVVDHVRNLQDGTECLHWLKPQILPCQGHIVPSCTKTGVGTDSQGLQHSVQLCAACLNESVLGRLC